MNDAVFDKLEFNRVREALADFCGTGLGKRMAHTIRPSTKTKQVRDWLGQVRELTESGHDINLYVVNEVDDMQKFVDAGAIGLITDFPQKLAFLIKTPE